MQAATQTAAASAALPLTPWLGTGELESVGQNSKQSSEFALHSFQVLSVRWQGLDR